MMKKDPFWWGWATCGAFGSKRWPPPRHQARGMLATLSTPWPPTAAALQDSATGKEGDLFGGGGEGAMNNTYPLS